jgi:glycosyltransferase involved in cell wall biosynthesis
VNLYLTQDRIGTPTGGGAVTFHEYRALEALGEAHPFDNVRIPVDGNPFKSDENFANAIGGVQNIRLTQIYAGCFTKTVRQLHTGGTMVSYTAAAHSIEESRREFEGLGIPFNFPHLTVPELWEKYVGGYKEADLVICPSTLSKKCMESYGCKNVVVVPHGCEMPVEVKPLPKMFTAGYLGQAGPDKGLRYLFEAWRRLNLKNAILLIAGNNIDQALPLWREFGGGNIEFMGFIKNVSEFYDRISLYVQPSATEGFGIEVLEAHAHARHVLCSNGTGACDLVAPSSIFEARDVGKLADLIESFKADPKKALEEGLARRKEASEYTWEKVRAKYAEAWNGLLASV